MQNIWRNALSSLLNSYRSSLQFKLFLNLTAVVALSLIAVMLSQIYLVQDYFVQQAESNLRSSNYLLSRVLADPIFENDLSMLQVRLQEIQTKLPLCNLQLKDNVGKVVFRLGTVQTHSDSEFNPSSRDGCFNTVIPVVHGESLLGTARMGVRTDDIARSRSNLIQQSIFFSIFWFALFMLPFFLKIRRMLSPVCDLAVVAKEIEKGNGNYSKQISTSGNDEISQLASSLQGIAKTMSRNNHAKIASKVAIDNEKAAQVKLKLMKVELTVVKEAREKSDYENVQAQKLLHQTQQSFQRLFPHQLIALMGKGSILDVKLGDQFERKLTLLNSDIRNFTSMSESMTPQESFNFLNSYLKNMEPIVVSNNGIVDKFIGDSILALFTEGADSALQAAIEMIDVLDIYNAGRLCAGYMPMQIGIGLNTGMAVVGTVGGTTRMDSTVIGDAVNITSRIESATKIYNTPILISQNTINDLTMLDKYEIRFVDRIKVKGKNQPISIFEVFNNDSPSQILLKKANKKKFEMALSYYHMNFIPQAMELLSECFNDNPDDIPAKIYMMRCNEYMAKGDHYSTGELNKKMVWFKEYVVNIQAIDSAHRNLFETVNEFIEASVAGDPNRVRSILDHLGAHLIDSKEEEVHLMLETNYPFIKQHLAEHRRFIRDFALLKEAVNSWEFDLPYLSFRFQLLMFDWFSDHIRNSDRHASRHILNEYPEVLI
jgi:hemerythrin